MEASLEAARSATSRAEATAKHTSMELERSRRLLAAGTIAVQAHQRAELEASVAAKQLEEARASTNLAEHELRLARAALASAVQKPSRRQERF